MLLDQNKPLTYLFIWRSEPSEHEELNGLFKPPATTVSFIPTITTTEVSGSPENRKNLQLFNLDGKKRNNRRSSSLKLQNGLRPNHIHKLNNEHRIHSIDEQQPLVAKSRKNGERSFITPLYIPEKSNSLDSYIDDFISPAMNYKDTSSRSPPIINTHVTSTSLWDKEDNISLYGTPKEEMLPGLTDSKGPSFMRSQIEALFQPSGKNSNWKKGDCVEKSNLLFFFEQTTNLQWSCLEAKKHWWMKGHVRRSQACS